MRRYEMICVGAGPAGLAAAVEAAKHGVQVIVFDENQRPGGQLFKQIHKFFGSREHHAMERGFNIGNGFLGEAKELGVEVSLNSVVLGIYENGVINVMVGDRIEQVKAQKTLIASGASENMIPFPGWTLPGVIGAGAAQTMANIHGIRPGNDILMVGSGNVGIIVSYQMLQAGSRVAAIIDAAPKIGGYAVHAAKIARVGPFTPCWETPFCHQAIREMCPAYKARKTCWRFGRGCNCDPGLVESLIRTGGVGASGDSRQRRVQQDYLRSDLQADLPTARERTISCAQCAIYMEHERAKFRFVNPIVVVGTIVALIVFYRPLLGLYGLTLTGMANLASTFSYGEQVDPKVWFDYLNTPTVQVFFLLMLGVLVLSWVLKFVEWAILVKKW